MWLGLTNCGYCCKNDSNLSQLPEEIPIASTKKPWKKMPVDTQPKEILTSLTQPPTNV